VILCGFIGNREHGQHGETLRFTRALFGLAPCLLSSVIEYHLDTWKAREPHVVAELRKSLYVDNLISDGTTVEETKELKERNNEIF